jgi:hypothetical protein
MPVDEDTSEPARVRGGLGGWRYWLFTIPLVALVTAGIISLLVAKF